MASTGIDIFENRTCIVDIVDIIGCEQQVVSHKNKTTAATLSDTPKKSFHQMVPIQWETSVTSSHILQHNRLIVVPCSL